MRDAAKHIAGGKLNGLYARPYPCPSWKESRKEGAKKRSVMMAGKTCKKPKCKMFPCVAILAKFNPEAAFRAEFDACPAVVAYRATAGAHTAAANDLR